jgi:hypothetical protein
MEETARKKENRAKGEGRKEALDEIKLGSLERWQEEAE